VKEGDGEEEEDVDAAAALPNAVAPVGAPSVCIASAPPRSLKEAATGIMKRTATRLQRCCTRWRLWERHFAVCGVEERGCDSDMAATFSHAVAPVGAPSAALAGLYGEWRGYSEPRCCAEKRRFRKDQVTQQNLVARRAAFGNWRLAAEQGSLMAWSVTTGVVYVGVLRGTADAGAGSNWVQARYKSKTTFAITKESLGGYLNTHISAGP
jgi:hypothetical protein